MASELGDSGFMTVSAETNPKMHKTMNLDLGSLRHIWVIGLCFDRSKRICALFWRSPPEISKAESASQALEKSGIIIIINSLLVLKWRGTTRAVLGEAGQTFENNGVVMVPFFFWPKFFRRSIHFYLIGQNYIFGLQIIKSVMF